MRARWLVIVGTALAALGCAGFGSRPVPLEPHDLALLFRARDLAQVYDISVSPAYATQSKVRAADGSVELSYEYDPTGASDVDSVYLHQQIYWEPERRSTQLVYAGARLGLVATVGDEFVPDAEVLTGFEQQECWSQVHADGFRVGVVCIARQDRVVLVLAVSGVALESTLAELYGPRLEAMKTYHPAG